MGFFHLIWNSKKKVVYYSVKKVYVYGILDDNDGIIYVGKSIAPRRRLFEHKKGYKRSKILAIYEDLENFWINKLIKEGHPLKNKEMLVDGEEWNVGDVIALSDKTKTTAVKIRHKQTGVIYESGYQAAKELDHVSYGIISAMKRYPKSKYHKEWELVDDL